MSGGDRQTLDFYDREAAAYADYAAKEGASAPLERFAAMVPMGGRVLDFGCGSGWAGAALAEQGFEVRGYDGSAKLAEEARRRYGLEVDTGPFEAFDARAAYDGIWCSFCLLHDTRKAMGGHLGRLARALKQGGAFYLGLKEGEGEDRDSLGRHYTYFTEPELRGWMEGFFSAIEVTREATAGFSGEQATALHIFARRA